MKKLLCCLLLLFAAPALATEPEKYREDAQLLERLINFQYAYLERLPNERYELTEKLASEAEAVSTQAELLRFVERALLLLADHHAVTGSSFSDSWAVFPSYADIWIEKRNGRYFVTQVRSDSPASRLGVLSDDVLIEIDGVPTQQSVDDFWRDLGVLPGLLDDGFAVRVLAAGRRDRARLLTLQRQSETPIELQLPNLYSVPSEERTLLTVTSDANSVVIKINDSLWQNNLAQAFDAAMEKIEPTQHITLDLTNTPTGGNTVVARAIMGWFVQEPTPYQIHKLPAEGRHSGIERQWAEYVLPRADKYHPGPVTLQVGRWTGSMGEGLALGFQAIGAKIEGTSMAGLLGAIYDERLPNSGMIVKIPVESLFSVDGTPREEFVPGR